MKGSEFFKVLGTCVVAALKLCLRNNVKLLYCGWWRKLKDVAARKNYDQKQFKTFRQFLERTTYERNDAVFKKSTDGTEAG